MDYANLHVHSEHSLLDGAAKITALAETAKKAGNKYLALTDHGSMSGAVQHKTACEKNGILPIYGCELFLIEEFKDLATTKQYNLHLTALAKDQIGFGMMLKGLGYANREGLGKSGKMRRPFLPIRYPLENGWKDHVVILSGCSSSPFYNLQKSDGIELFGQYAEYFGKDFYGEVMPLHDWDVQKGINEVVAITSEALERKIVCTNDIHYCHGEDSDLHELVITMSQYGMTWNNPKRWKFSTHQNFLRAPEDMVKSLMTMGMDRKLAEAAIINTNEVAEKCHFKLNKYPLDLPNPLPEGQDEEGTFVSLLHDGMQKRGLYHKDNYWDRLNYEVGMLTEKGFIRYMLIVADAIQWAKSHGIFIGPGRGSAGGSLVSYVLGITEIDPLKYNLPFERFVAPDRIDLPDIDIDIEDRNRNIVEQYLKEKYGESNVAHVSTYTALLGRSALKDTARVFEVPPFEVNAVTPLIPRHQEGDARFYNTIEDTLEENADFQSFQQKYPRVVALAQKLEGQIRGMGTHAAGFVVSSSNLQETTRGYLIPSESGLTALNWDKDDLEFFGLIKIDFLGLATHSVIAATLDLIKTRTGRIINPSEIPFDDPKVFTAIGRGDTATMFTLSAAGTAAYCREMKPDTLNEISDAIALWRPGPIVAGMCDAYTKVKRGEKQPEYFCPEYKTIVEGTRGQLIYQEQITELLMNMAGFNYVDADKVRKIVGKKYGAEALNKYRAQFVEGCKLKKTMTESQSTDFWNSLSGFASYAFNRSHSISYAIVAYWTAWLKVNYPLEYLCSYLNYAKTDRETKDGETHLDIALREASRIGLKVLPPSIKTSLEDWTAEGDSILRAGLKEVRNIGPSTKAELARVRTILGTNIQSIKQIRETAEKSAMNISRLKSLAAAGAFDDLSDAEEFKKSYCITLKDRPKALNYNEVALKDYQSAIAGVLEALGEGYGMVGTNEIQQISDGTTWSISDVLQGNMPGLKAKIINPSKANTQEVFGKTVGCSLCDLRHSCNAPVPIEKGSLNVMIVAEAPGMNEDKAGRPLVGDSGKMLFDNLKELGLTRKMFYIDNTVHCRPVQNAMKDLKYVDACPWLTEAIAVVKPKLILALGNKALYYFRRKEAGITAMSGTTEWSEKHKAWITYCTHPANVLRDPTPNGNKLNTFLKGLNEFKRVLANLCGD